MSFFSRRNTPKNVLCNAILFLHHPILRRLHIRLHWNVLLFMTLTGCILSSYIIYVHIILIAIGVGEYIRSVATIYDTTIRNQLMHPEMMPHLFLMVSKTYDMHMYIYINPTN